jgi:pyruvate kinase
MERYAKIIATIGPASQKNVILREMIKAGMNVARLNFSHGTHEEHQSVFNTIREISKELDIPVAILADLCGPKIRVGALPPEGVPLIADDSIYIISTDNEIVPINNLSNSSVISINIPNIFTAFQPGNRILMDDGKLELVVEDIVDQVVKARVVTGGILKSHKGVNLPAAKLSVNALTDKDLFDLEFALHLGVDAIAISFVRSREDILYTRKKTQEFTQDPNFHIPIIAKIERPEAVENLDSILDVTDGIMVARGDLGIETSTATVPIIQKSAIQKALIHSKYVITATQMLESMIENPRPTRAEASDVANAIFDGTDAVMLSGETAVGKYPIESIRNMDEIVRTAEQNNDSWSICSHVHVNDKIGDDALSICRAANELAHDTNVECIAVFTLTGRTALYMSKVRPRVTIHAFTPHENTYNRLALYWGVFPHKVEFAHSVENMISIVDKALQSTTIHEPGQQVVMLSGLPVNAMRAPNMALLHTIGEPY